MSEAIVSFKKACDLEGSSVHFNNSGLAKFHDKQTQAAIEDFEKAIQLNSSGDPTIYFNKGNALLHMGKVTEAIEDYN